MDDRQNMQDIDNTNEQEALRSAVEGGQKPKKNAGKEAWEWVVSIATALMVVFILNSFVLRVIRVDGDSMRETLQNGERLFVNVLDMRLNGIDRGDVVICHYPNRGVTNFVKRAVGVPGDSVYRKNSITHVVYAVKDAEGNEQIIDEMLDMTIPYGSLDYEPYTLKENEYFVVGDNRNNSHDSRDWNDSNSNNDVGPITGDMIVGKVKNVIWPISNMREVK